MTPGKNYKSELEGAKRIIAMRDKEIASLKQKLADTKPANADEEPPIMTPQMAADECINITSIRSLVDSMRSGDHTELAFTWPIEGDELFDRLILKARLKGS